MIAKAEVKYIRGSARKIRLVLDLVRGMNAARAVHFLKFIHKGSSYEISKVVRSAIANAKNKGLDAQDLVISRITADEGPRWKRFRAATFGRAGEILKKTSHISVELDLERDVVPAAPKVVPAAPVKPEKKRKVAADKKKIK